jgi:hypothetical protein
MKSGKSDHPSPRKEQSEGKEVLNQVQTIFQYLHKNIATASMVSFYTGIPQKNICRYKRDMEKAGLLWEVRKAYCNLTGFKAWYLTTNKDKAPSKTEAQAQYQQLSLF